MSIKIVKHKSMFLLILGFVKNTFSDYVTLNQKLILPESSSEIFRYEQTLLFLLLVLLNQNKLKKKVRLTRCPFNFRSVFEYTFLSMLITTMCV